MDEMERKNFFMLKCGWIDFLYHKPAAICGGIYIFSISDKGNYADKMGMIRIVS